ncbi:MAG: DUF2177 family protein [Candidatus Saccharimonadales bacterium]
MAETLKLYLIAALIFTAIDFVWLRFVARSMYQKYLSELLAPKPNLLAAVVFYVLFLVGMLVFVIVPAHDHHTVLWATGYGALFGFFTYLTYDLTNLATLKNWPLRLSLIDIVWGSALSAAVAGLTVLVA